MRRRNRALIFTFILCITIPSVAQVSKRKAPAAPSLDLLLSRVDAYWKFLVQKKKSQAAQFINASDRENFIAVAIPPFSDSRFKSLELSADRKEATTTVIVKRALAPLAEQVEWPVIESWRFEKGNWYRRFQGFSLPIAQSPGAKLSPEQVDDIKREILGKLRIEDSILDFGTVRDSSQIQLSLKYTLTGSQPLAATFKTPGFVMQGLSNGSLLPGEHRELILTAPGWDREGVVDEKLVLTAHLRGISVPFEVAVKGNIYVPVSLSPSRLKLDKDTPEREILVRNNSKSSVELVRLFTETGRAIVEPLPATIAAGQQRALKIRLSGKSGTTPRDNLVISFAQPVDGVSVLSLTVEFSSDGGSAETGDPGIIQSDKSKTCKAAPAN